MSNLKYQHRAEEIMHHYMRGISMDRIGRLLKIPCMCVCRVIQQHKKNAIKPSSVHVLDLERKDGALVSGHALIERSLWAGLEHWRDLH